MEKCAKELLRIAEEISGNDESAKMDAAVEVGYEAALIAGGMEHFTWVLSDIQKNANKGHNTVEIISTEEAARGDALYDKIYGLVKAFWTSMGSEDGDDHFDDDAPRDWNEVKAVADQIKDAAAEIADYVAKTAHAALDAIHAKVEELEAERERLAHEGVDNLTGKDGFDDFDRMDFDSTSSEMTSHEEELDKWREYYKDVVWGRHVHGEGSPRALIRKCLEFRRNYQNLVNALGK